MKYFALIDPCLPEKAVKKLKNLDIEPLAVPVTGLVDRPVAGHPDIQVFLHHGAAFVHPDIDSNFHRELSLRCEVKSGLTRLSPAYPRDIAYNIAAAGNFAFHKTNVTDPVIVDYLKGKDVTLIDVKQGYTKCSTLIVDDRSIITADLSIHNAALKNDFDSLIISPGHINLPGYKYGFIGGAAGKFDNMVLITGSIDHHPDRDRIYSFIEAKGLSVMLLSDEPACDSGSILISSY